MRRALSFFIRVLPVLVALLPVPLALADGWSPASPEPGRNQETPVPQHGGAPVFDDRPVPHRWLPPGSERHDTGPSQVIFPAQQLPLRFNHAKHVSKDVGANCKTCHANAYTSDRVSDSLVPPGTVCDACHSTDHDDPSHVKPGDEASGQCAYCHLGYKASAGNAVAELALPRANLVFNHKAHAERNVGCPQCHGAVGQLELATRDQLPRMAGCFSCHNMPDAASRGQAKGECTTCHLKGTTGTAMKTTFASGLLEPPRWLHNAEHTPDFIDRHKTVAGDDSQFCANCHKEDFCTDCHDGRVRPRSIHPNDYVNMHPVEARMEPQKCASCHREQSFCLDCHMRAGVAESSPGGVKESGRFHPPKQVWSGSPMGPGHHGFEAERNLNACVSCHVERDCVTCHGALGVGGGFDPHKNGFVAGCRTQYRRNPRPCFVCHGPGDRELAQCE